MPSASKARSPRAPRSVHISLETIHAAQAGDPAARDQVIAAYDYIPHVLARRMRGHAPLEDLVGYGFVGLVKALNTFDACRGNGFSTYAWVVTYHEIARGLDLEPIVRVPAASRKRGLSADWATRRVFRSEAILALVAREDDLERDEALEWESRALSALPRGRLLQLEKRLHPSRHDHVDEPLQSPAKKLAALQPALAERAGTAVEFVADLLRRRGPLTSLELIRAGITVGYERHEILAAILVLRVKERLVYHRTGYSVSYSIKEGEK